jgi:hypothetical protein
MKKVLILALGVVLAASVAFADHVGIYSDTGGTSCTTGALAFPPTVNNAYVIHKFSTGTNGSRWKINDTSGIFHASATTPYGVLGDPYTGASVAYGNCLSGSILVYTLGFLYFGQPLTCGMLEMVPDPLESAGTIVYSDCNFVKKLATGGKFYLQADGTCQDCNEVATEETTWGTIKALYR